MKCPNCGLVGELGVTWWGECVRCKYPSVETLPADGGGPDDE